MTRSSPGSEEYRYARDLLVSFVNEHCDPVPEWKPNDDLLGILIQFDNALTVVRSIKVGLDPKQPRDGAARTSNPAPFCTCPCSCDETPHDGLKCRLHDTVTDWEDVEQLTNIRGRKPRDAASLTERLIQSAVDYETGRCSRRELSEARAAVEAAITRENI